MKKDKKAPEDTLAPEEEALPKDYQQEEDEDVKEKHKLAKIVIAIILFIIIFFILLLMWKIGDESKEHFYDVDGERGAAAVMADDSGAGTEVDGCLLDLTGPTVDVIIPLEYFEDKQPADTLSETEKASGYAAVKKVGGNVIYTIKTAYYPSIVSGLYEFHSDDYQKDEFLEENDVMRFAQFSYMQKFTVTISAREFFSANDYYDLLEHAYYQSAIYQSYLGIAPADIKVSFQFKYEGAQFPFVEYKFPDMLNKNLSSIAVSDRQGTAPNSAASRFGFVEEPTKKN